MEEVEVKKMIKLENIPVVILNVEDKYEFNVDKVIDITNECGSIICIIICMKNDNYIINCVSNNKSMLKILLRKCRINISKIQK